MFLMAKRPKGPKTFLSAQENALKNCNPMAQPEVEMKQPGGL